MAAPLLRPARLVGDTLAATAGGGLAAATAAITAVRSARPLHPRGVVGPCTVTLDGNPAAPTPLLRSEQTLTGTARFSWAVGTGPTRTDIHGLALRLRADDDAADFLFATTGQGLVSRYLLGVQRPGHFGFMGSLLPVKGEHGAVLLGVEPALASTINGDLPPTRWTLSVTTATGPWIAIGTVECEWGDHDDSVRADPLQHHLPELPPYRWVTALREPAYWMARKVGPRAKAEAPSQVRS